MESGGIQVLMAALPGQRVTPGLDVEDGSVLAYRGNGDECLFASWEDDPKDPNRGKGMVWIPVGEFSPDPEAIKPPDIVETTESEPIDDGTGTTEADPGHGPMGGASGGRSGLRKRPTVEG